MQPTGLSEACRRLRRAAVRAAGWPALLVFASVWTTGAQGAPGIAGAAPGADDAGIAGAPGTGGHAGWAGSPPASESEDVVVDLRAVPAGDRRALAEAVPQWEESIAAGTERITVPRALADDLRAKGFDVDVVASAPVRLPAWPGCYARLAEVHGWAATAAAARPDILEVFDVGDSGCKAAGGCTTPGGDAIPGADILVVRVTRESATSPKEGRLWIDGGLHAREIPTVALAQAFIRHLVDGYGRDAQITYLLDHREVYVGLASNPDGRQLVELGASAPYDAAPWMWRKNGRDVAASTCGWPPRGGGHAGVDLNRNHAFKWDAEGGSEQACAETYRGPAPGSEPEVQAYAAFVRSIIPDQRGPEDGDEAPLDTTGFLINFHNATFPGTMLVPWGWTTARAPNADDLYAIARRYTAFNGYRVQSALYPVSGNTRDWGYGELGIPSYVIELQGSDFVAPCAELEAVIRQNLEALVMTLGLSDRPYQRINGPEVTRLTLRPALAPAGTSVAVSARATDLRAGGQRVAAVEMTVGRPGGGPVAAGGGLPVPGAAAGEGVPLIAGDGAFDEVSEDAGGTLAARDLAAGRHYVVVRARDALGRWGPPRAQWIEVLDEAPDGRGTPGARLRRPGWN